MLVENNCLYTSSVNGKAWLEEDDLWLAITMLLPGHIYNLPSYAWHWDSVFTGRKIKRINYQDLTHPIMTLKYSSVGIRAVVFKYETRDFYDNDPTYAKPAQVVKVFNPWKDIEESSETDGSNEFRVKHGMDAREYHDLLRLFKNASGLNQIPLPLWERKLVIEGEWLRTTILSLANIERFTSLPEVKWEWRDKTIKPIRFSDLAPMFSRLLYKGELAGIAIKWKSASCDKYAQGGKNLFLIVKVILFTEQIALQPLHKFSSNETFQVDRKLLSYEAFDIKNSRMAEAIGS